MPPESPAKPGSLPEKTPSGRNRALPNWPSYGTPTWPPAIHDEFVCEVKLPTGVPNANGDILPGALVQAGLPGGTMAPGSAMATALALLNDDTHDPDAFVQTALLNEAEIAACMTGFPKGTAPLHEAVAVALSGKLYGAVSMGTLVDDVSNPCQHPSRVLSGVAASNPCDEVPLAASGLCTLVGIDPATMPDMTGLVVAKPGGNMGMLVSNTSSGIHPLPPSPEDAVGDEPVRLRDFDPLW